MDGRDSAAAAKDGARFSDKERLILDRALELLKESGDAGLTLRKLAERSGMRLSNVQYYFKSRQDVLKAMAARYFGECAGELRALARDADGATVRERARRLILTGLSHGDELSDMCRIFRELWAISTRNPEIDAHMADYYRTFASLIAHLVLGEAAEAESRDRIASLLLPFFEGYSVTAPSLPMSTEDVAEMLTELAVSVASTSPERTN